MHVYKYNRMPFTIEYVTFKKKRIEGTELFYFKSEPEYSTIKTNDLSEEEFIKKIECGELVFERYHNYYVDLRKLKTGGCECGIWALYRQDSFFMHSRWCPLYMDPFSKIGEFKTWA